MDKVEQFKKDIIKLCKQYKLSISHEDGHGNFIIDEYKESNIEWFKSATFDTDLCEKYYK